LGTGIGGVVIVFGVIDDIVLVLFTVERSEGHTIGQPTSCARLAKDIALFDGVRGRLRGHSQP